MDLVQHELLMIALVFAFGLIGTYISSSFKIPDVAIFMIFGILLGPSVIGLIQEPISSGSYQFIILIGSILILYEGGRAIQFSVLKKVWITVTLLSIPGVLITAAVVSLTAYYFLDIPFIYALLLASIIASTDPASIMPVFKQVKIRDKVRQTVESESAFNDATGSILTFTVLGLVLGKEELSISGSIGSFVFESIGGIIIGILVGYIAIWLKSGRLVAFFQDYGVVISILSAIGSYLLASHFEASGFMATFVAGLMSGNSKSLRIPVADETDHSIAHFFESLTFMLRKLIFMFLGSQVDFQTLAKYWLPGMIIVLIFMFIARPLTVMSCALYDKKANWEWKEIIFMFWVRETGVIPAALCGMIASSGAQHVDVISSVVFLAILTTILIQASTTGYWAKKTGVTI